MASQHRTSSRGYWRTTTNISCGIWPGVTPEKNTVWAMSRWLLIPSMEGDEERQALNYVFFSVMWVCDQEKQLKVNMVISKLKEKVKEHQKKVVHVRVQVKLLDAWCGGNSKLFRPYFADLWVFWRKCTCLCLSETKITHSCLCIRCYLYRLNSGSIVWR